MTPLNILVAEYIERLDGSPERPCPDVFLLDLNLPKVGGQEVLSRFRAHPLCIHTPYRDHLAGRAAERERTAAYGAARYFRKLTDLDEFLKLGVTVKRLANVHRPD